MLSRGQLLALRGRGRGSLFSRPFIFSVFLSSTRRHFSSSSAAVAQHSLPGSGHSVIATHHVSNGFQVRQVPAFEDNYIYFLRHEPSNTTVCVDPGDAGVVNHWLREWKWELNYIWVTHHHDDHVGGLEAVLRANPGCQVVGHQAASKRIPHISLPLKESWPPQIPASPDDGPPSTFRQYASVTNPLESGWTMGSSQVRVHVLSVPGHTLDHCAFWVPAANSLFCGDTLFAMGCGRLFEGTALQMYQSLETLVTSLPRSTVVFPAHEYTLENAEFALSVEPQNQELKKRAVWVKEQRMLNRPTAMTSLELELATNPFLRTKEASLQKIMRPQLALDPVFVLQELRLRKDHFVPVSKAPSIEIE